MELMKELGPGVRLVSHPGAPAIARTTRRQRLKNSPNYNPETDEETEAEGVGEFGRRRSVLYLDPDTGDAYWGNSGDYTPSSSGSSKPSVGRQILSTREQYRIESESDQSRHGHSNVLRQDSPLLPAAPIDPEGLTMPARKGSLRAMASMDSARDEELAELLTARRVRVSDLPSPPNSPQAEEEMSAGPSSWLGAAGLARLRRISFFKRESPLRNTSPMSSKAGSRPVSFQVSPLGDRDVEAGQALLKAEMGVRDGARPISTVSGKSAVSGGTMYHDAASRPQSAVPGSFPSSYRTAQTHPQESQGSRVPATPAVEEVPEIPPVPSLPGESHMQEFSDVSETQPSGTDESHGGLSPGVDILDLPAPSAEESFSTTANRSRKDLVFPPGLSSSPLPNHWDSAQTPSEEIDSYHGHNLHAPAAVDVLEEEPPRAGEGWRSLASGAGGGDRRTTFGSVGNPTVVHPRDITHSEQGSLHSMRSHLSPFSSRSPSGSAAASSPSSRHMLIGSGSSRGTHSQGPSGSSGGSHSLGHSGSISSDSRRRGRRDASDINAPPPPIGRVSLGATGRGVASPLYQMTPQPTAGAGDDHAVVSSTVTTKATASTATTGSSMTDPVTGAVMHFPTVPWTGADSDWPADAWIEMPGRGGRRLGGPPSQWRSLQTRIGDAEAERRS
ncbi:hypothetical protein OE88DRAFT_1249897 [Heliocybe sulcata]|uniref:Uncharacterized protein n=1 Tax=Heliocybe sulcata TaxID=5364 RepID=A0A5C3NAF5_9AGAM|nr:hypothetical protein OE88DRAFT_1249897 [Heliocybe sulcata]